MAKSNQTSKTNDKPVIGIDLGGTKILGAVVTPKGEILARAKKKTQADKGPEQILDRIVEVARLAAEMAEIDVADCAGLGIGAPGQIDFTTGTIIYAPNLGWKDVALCDHLTRELGIRVKLDNDVNVVAVAEHRWGMGKGIDNLVAISVGTGIGSGIILNGQLWHGFNGTAGELGHCVIDQDGPKWKPSNRGCVEAMASRTAIAKKLVKAMKDGAKTSLKKVSKQSSIEIRSKLLLVAAEAGDQLVIGELNEASRLLGITAGNVINFLNPEMIVFGGGVIEAMSHMMMPTIEETARAYSIANSADNVKIVASELGDDAGLLGAAALALD